jgi:hypothetical protein
MSISAIFPPWTANSVVIVRVFFLVVRLRLLGAKRPFRHYEHGYACGRLIREASELFLPIARSDTRADHVITAEIGAYLASSYGAIK